MIKKVLVVVDGSIRTHSCIEHVVQMAAAQSRSPIEAIVLTVQRPPSLSDHISAADALRQARERSGDAVAGAVAELTKAGLRVRASLEFDQSELEAVMRTARAEVCDHIVLSADIGAAERWQALLWGRGWPYRQLALLSGADVTVTMAERARTIAPRRRRTSPGSGRRAPDYWLLAQ